MMEFSILDFPDYLFTIGKVSTPAEVWKIKRLPRMEYHSLQSLWVAPIRPGLADAVEKQFGVILAEPLRVMEAAFLNLLEPAFLESVNMNEVTAAQAVELAVLHHLYDYHKGDVAEYNKVHYPYRIGE